ncbi:MAG: F-type H+-transporting ATPase subunit gamma [Clostridia bacterium]|nr:F-type H+-transporting ATPase subunit gamma [Clostridia bacterium]MDN5323440.1 F-type H+-transporting ATPase subunit gamma [Clostridia bacterium]
MASVRDIKRRIRSVKNTQQITKAMEMVAAAKLRRTQGAVVAARPYAQKLKEVLSRLVASSDGLKDPLLEVREPKKIGFVVVTADRGLAGGYNANLIRTAVASMAKHRDLEIGILAIGKKARDFFRKRRYSVEGEFVGISDIPTLGEAKEITETIRTFYTEGIYDEVYLVYTEFITAMQQKPKTKKLLPIEAPVTEDSGELDYIFDPSPQIVLNNLLPLYLTNQVFSALMEAKASEHGARMTAMGSATDNAGEMIDQLTLSYNRARQAAITREISEIVGGANALQG